MNENELRAINPEDFEGKDIKWQNGADWKFTGKVIYDYDMGLSIVKKDDTEYCLTGLHGPSYKGNSNYTTKELYHKMLTIAFNMLKDRFYDGEIWKEECDIVQIIFGSTSCSFS